MFGAFAVLYSTFFVASASHARVCADALRVFGVSSGGEAAYRYWVRVFCITLPLLFLASSAFFQAPKELVLAGGFMGALMLPLLGVAALYFRYRRCDARLVPGKVWDFSLWVSCAGLFVAGGYALYSKVVAELCLKIWVSAIESAAPRSIGSNKLRHPDPVGKCFGTIPLPKPCCRTRPGHNPVGVGNPTGPSPKVGLRASGQPWAVRLNPVGVGWL